MTAATASAASPTTAPAAPAAAAAPLSVAEFAATHRADLEQIEDTKRAEIARADAIISAAKTKVRDDYDAATAEHEIAKSERAAAWQRRTAEALAPSVAAFIATPGKPTAAAVQAAFGSVEADYLRMINANGSRSWSLAYAFGAEILKSRPEALAHFASQKAWHDFAPNAAENAARALLAVADPGGAVAPLVELESAVIRVATLGVPASNALEARWDALRFGGHRTAALLGRLDITGRLPFTAADEKRALKNIRSVNDYDEPPVFTPAAQVGLGP